MLRGRGARKRSREESKKGMDMGRSEGGYPPGSDCDIHIYDISPHVRLLSPC
jgi:hypothetical protein